MKSSCARVVGFAAVFFLTTPLTTWAHTTRGHNVLEASAYKSLLKKKKGEIARFPDYSGKDILDYLIARRILRIPPCYPVLNAVDGSCVHYDGVDSLKWLPLIGSGDMDAIMFRQFSKNGQNFHFMATPGDIYRYPDQDARTGMPRGLSEVAYPRAVRFIGGMFYHILANRDKAKEQYRDIYALIHTIGDSFSNAHVERDTATWGIYYLKPWQASAWQPYLFHWVGWQYFFGESHHVFPDDERDKHYLKPDSVKAGEIDYYEINPYIVPENYFNERGLAAVRAIEDLLMTTFATLLKTGDDPSNISEIATEEWKSYLRTHFLSAVEGDATINTIRLEPVSKDEEEWRPLTMLGIRGRYGSSRNSRDAILAMNFGKPPSYLDPFAFTAGYEVGRRFTGKDVTWFGALNFTVYLWQYSDYFAWGIDPSVIEITFGRSRTTVEPLVSFLRFDTWVSKRLWLSIEGPRYSVLRNKFRSTEFGLTLGVCFSKDIPLHIISDRRLYPPPERPLGEKWETPDPDSPRRLSAKHSGIFHPFGYSVHKEARHVSMHPIGYSFLWRPDRTAKVSRLSYGVTLGPGLEFFDDRLWGFGKVGPLVRYKVMPVLTFGVEPSSLVGKIGFLQNAPNTWGVHGIVDVVLAVGTVEIQLEVLRYDYREKRLDQRGLAGVKIGIPRD